MGRLATRRGSAGATRSASRADCRADKFACADPHTHANECTTADEYTRANQHAHTAYSTANQHATANEYTSANQHAHAHAFANADYSVCAI